jgi:eukaryotic-like serine/threonine-protein kinase
MERVSLGKIGRYEIIKVLGRGGMGEVILAQDENLGRRVAIKRPFKSAVAEGLARFQVEAKAATLRHPNIPAVYEMGVHEDLPFIAMEFVEGETLEKIIETRRNELDLITKLRIMEQVCSALGYAHENGVVHRDIKPANIIVQPDGVAKIIDFGIAKVQDETTGSDLTKPSQLIGSLHYIAPERFLGGATDGRVDIFSVGVTLFKLLTGKEPFTGGEATASFKIMNEAHASLAAFMHDYPPVLDEILAKSLAKNPDDRYQTGEDFADALHEVIEDLKRTRVTELFSDAERLTTERRFAPALELLDEAIKLDPSNTQARKLRKFVREHQERIRRAERLRECLLRGDEAVLSGNFDEAISQFKDALNLDPESTDIRARIQSVEEKKRRFESSTRALAESDRAKARGDITGALRIVAKALQEDPENKKLIAANAALVRQMEIEAQRGRLLELLESATRALAARDYDAADKLLLEANEIDPANPDTDKLRRELAKARELEQRRAILDEIQLRVQDFLKTDAYDQASDLLNRALDKLPNEAMLHRLKAEVDTEARNYDLKRVVDLAISQANELFASSPFEALSALQRALETIPGEERLVAYERSLRHQLEAQRSEQLRDQTVLKARELMSAKQFDKAVGVLESFQVEFGQQADIDELLVFARGERATQQRAEIVSRSLSEARALIREGRLEDAIRLLESGEQQTGDASISGLLREVREQQAASARKFEALMKRVELLRSRGELDEAIQLLQDQLAATPGNATVQQLSNSLLAERKQRQVTTIAIRAAKEATRQNDFAAAMESLQTLVNAYGESAEVAAALKEVESQRSSHAGETVAKSIEAAQASLLKKDPTGALEALKAATASLEFADAQKQAEWQRIGQSVKKALQQAGATGTHGLFDQQLSAIAQTKPRRAMTLVIAAAGLVGLILIGILIWKLAPPKQQGLIEIQSVTPGAKVLIDGNLQSVDAQGNVKLTVKPGVHRIQISKDGFQSKDRSDDIEGQYVTDGTLFPVGTRLGNMKLILAKDLPKVSVTADGKSYGDFGPDQKVQLPVGAYTVTFTAPGYQPSTVTNVQIAESPDTEVPVNLTKIEPKEMGSVAIQLQGDLPAARVFANGKPYGEFRSNQKISLAEGIYTLRYEYPGYEPSEVRGVKIAKSTEYPAIISLKKIVGPVPTGSLTASQNSIQQGESVTLAWQSQNISAAEISGLGAVPISGTRQVTPAATTTYALTSNNGTHLAEVTIQVIQRPTPLKPTLINFDVSPSPVDRGLPVTITWAVNNSSSVDITDVGHFDSASGSKVFTPSRSTTFKLIVGGEQLAERSVEVREPKVIVSLPDKGVLEAALGPYKAVFQNAAGKSCKSAFSSNYNGNLRDFAIWCGDAKSFTAVEQCSAVSGTVTEPTLTCSENVIVPTKDGGTQKFPSQKVFKFKQGSDEKYQLDSWK